MFREIMYPVLLTEEGDIKRLSIVPYDSEKCLCPKGNIFYSIRCYENAERDAEWVKQHREKV